MFHENINLGPAAGQEGTSCFLGQIRAGATLKLALAEHFHVLSFTTFDAGGKHFQSFMLEKPTTALP